MSRRFLAAPLLAAGLMLTAAGCDNTAGGPPAGMGRGPARVSTVTLHTQPVDIERELTGRTSAYRWAEVRPEVGGILKERIFKEGAMVKEGEVLYRIEPDTYLASLNRAKADLASAQANLEVTQLRERRIADMLRTRSVSRQDYDDARAALAQARAAVQSCRANVEAAEINYRRTEVRAPISGRITISNFTAGALLTASQPTPLATIYQMDPMYVELSQASDDLYALKRQMEERGGADVADIASIKATLTMADGSVYDRDGHLNFTGVDVNRQTNTITLRAEFPNPENTLLPGLFVRARLVMGQDTNAILVPQRAVLRDLQGQPYVYVVEDGKALRRGIRLTRAVGQDWYVHDGLKAGEKVILGGVSSVRDGAPVQEVAQAPGAGAGAGGDSAGAAPAAGQAAGAEAGAGAGGSPAGPAGAAGAGAGDNAGTGSDAGSGAGAGGDSAGSAPDGDQAPAGAAGARGEAGGAE